MTMTFSMPSKASKNDDDWKESQKYTILRCGDKTFKEYNLNYVTWLLYKKGYAAHVPFERTQQIAIGLGNLYYDSKALRFLDEDGFNYLIEKFDAECVMYLDWGSYLE